jgi:hypothetical protein
MRRTLIAAIAALAAGTVAYADDPAPQADPNAEHAPATRMDQATPDITTETTAQQKLDLCMRSWDTKTHITKANWRKICERQL